MIAAHRLTLTIAAWLGWVAVVMALVAVSGALLPAAAHASLPDKRVYEQVSPANKYGNEAGVRTEQEAEIINDAPLYSLATPDGNNVFYVGSGAIGAAAGSPLVKVPAVSRRTPGSGWATAGVLPRTVGAWEAQGDVPAMLVPSENLSYMMWADVGSYMAGGEPADLKWSSNIYLAGPGPAGAPVPDPFIEPVWLGRPEVASPVPALGHEFSTSGLSEAASMLPAGPPSSSGIAYFSYAGTLLPEDASRVPNIGKGFGRENQNTLIVPPWGFYEWREGVLRSAGTLPADSLYPGQDDPWGAEPAGPAGSFYYETRPTPVVNISPSTFGNEVSSDGSRAFFVSPGMRTAHPAGDPPELYLRESGPGGSVKTVLVSQDALLPTVNGLAAPAPHGVSAVVRPYAFYDAKLSRSAAYATPDGSRVFFASLDRLNEEAPEQPAGHVTVKEYEFEVEANGGAGRVRYIPGVTGPVLMLAADGSRVLFENTAAAIPAIELWQRSSQGVETIVPVAQLSRPEARKNPNVGGTGSAPECGGVCVLIPDAHASADGSVFVFETTSPLPGGFNNGGGFDQIYRYEVASARLTCVSCPPRGVVPSGDASLSNDLTTEPLARTAGWLDSRGVSEDGGRVFFDTPDSLVAADSNGTRDVYEWEDGRVFLVSDGVNPEPSFYMDNSANGSDVFFATAAGLVSGDTDGGYDVYDARVPHPGDNPPPAAVPCQGEVCQGPPSVPSLLGAPPSATFSGPGNIAQPSAAPAPKATSKHRPKHRKKIKKKTRAKRATRRGRR